MANATRVLFVSDEVAPFSNLSEVARMIRHLPEKLVDSGDFEVRIMTPRYGTISERKNRLHEVIRLSGTDVTIGPRSETLKVKVASIPGIRLQVYFMDNAHFFKRKGLYHDKQGKVFNDNVERSLFFGCSTLETIRNLGWKPSIVHAAGWLSGSLPFYLKTIYATDPLFENTRTVFTPLAVDIDQRLTKELLESLALPVDATTMDKKPDELGVRFADSVVELDVETGEENGEAVDPAMKYDGPFVENIRDVYKQLLNEVPA